MIDLIKQLITIFSSSIFNIALFIDIIQFCIGVFRYIHFGNLNIFRFWTIVACSFLSIIVLVGFLFGYRIEFDLQDKMYILTFILYIFLFAFSFIHKSYFIKISKYLIFCILSFFFFFSFDKINLSSFITISIAFYLLSLLVCNLRKNNTILRETSILLFLNLLIFSILKFPNIEICIINFSRIIYLIYIITLFVSFGFSFIPIKSKNDTEPESSKNKSDETILNLFEEREKDLQRLISLLDSKELGLIGIQSIWGNGKSYLFKLLKQNFCDKYNIITISVLSLKVDEIENLLLTEIFHILEQNKIFSTTSTKLKNLFSQSFFHDLGEIFIEKKSYSELILQLKKDISLLDKKIIITFEDMDRISDENCIYKILSLAEELTDENIKIVFQYEEKKLLKLLNLSNNEYLEKYIPYTMHLSEIPFSKILLKELSSSNEYQNLQLSYFDILFKTFYLSSLTIMHFDDFSIIPCNYLLSNTIQIRKVETFLKEINEYLKNQLFQEYKNIVIILLFIKHFDVDFFNILLLNKNYFDLPILILQDKNISLRDAFKLSPDEYKDALQNKLNEKRIIYSLLFDFHLSELQTNNRNTYLENEKIKEENSKINHIIKYLLFTGEEESTKQEKLSLKIVEIMKSNSSFDSKDKKLNEIFVSYSNIFNPSYTSDCLQKFAEIFKSVNIYISDLDILKTLIELYFYYIEKEYSNYLERNILDALCYIDYTKDELLIMIMQKFSSLMIVYNITSYDNYVVFLSLIISKLIEKNYLPKSKIELNRIDKRFWYDDALKLLKEYSDILNNDSKSFSNLKAKEKITIISNFINKNIEIFNEEDEEEPPEYDDERYNYERRIDYYHAKGYSADKIEEIANTDYDNNRISLNEYRELLNESKSKT